MKKIFTCLLVMLLLVMGNIFPIAALTYDESYTLAKNYFQNLSAFQSVDEIIASESVGVETDQKVIPEELLATDTASNVAKTIIVLTLHGNDPRNYNGVNYVELLESAIQSDGAVHFENENGFGSNNQIFCVDALYIVGSDKQELAADYLASMIQDNGAFTYAGGYEDLAVTGWAIEALSLVNQEKYQPTIQQDMTYILSYQKEDAGFDMYGYGADANTQACVLAGLLTYDSAGVKAGTYNQNEHNPYDVLLSFQNSDGSFWYSFTGEGQYNLLATVQGVQTIGYYYNGSVYQKAHQAYLALGEVTEIEKEPEIPVEEDQVKEDKETSSTEMQNDNQTKEESSSQKADVVQTDDSSWLIGYSLLFIGSGILLLKGRQYLE